MVFINQVSDGSKGKGWITASLQSYFSPKGAELGERRGEGGWDRWLQAMKKSQMG